MDESMPTKVCRKCLAEKPLADFPLRNGKPLARCRPCLREAGRSASQKWRERNPEKVREQFKAWLNGNRERNVDRVRAWRQAHPDSVSAANQRFYGRARNDPSFRDAKNDRGRNYYAANRDAVLQRQAERQKTPEGRQAAVLKTNRRRALKAESHVGVVDPVALWVSAEGKCGICGDPLDAELRWPDPLSRSIDHITPLAKGGAHSQDNLQWAHLVCNLRKHTN